MNISLAKEIDLSICIVSWNVKDLLRECLSSIGAATPALKFEVVVVDNNSRDGSVDMVRKEFPSVTLISNRVNRGFAFACNQVIRGSRSRYILLLNPDTLIQSGSLEEMVRFLDERPSAGGGGPKLINPDGSLQPSVRMYPTFKSSLGQFTILGDLGFFHQTVNRYLEKGFDYEYPSIVEQPMGAALFFRRSALDAVGLLDESFFLYFEEVDLCLRLFLSGRSLWYNPGAVIVHIGGGSTGKAAGLALFRLMESQFKYFIKHFGPRPTAWFKIIFKPLFLLGEYWSLIRNLASLLGAYISGSPRAEKERKKNRLRMRWDFLTKYLIDFLLL
jgi:GT2 family glycosyltransferase